VSNYQFRKLNKYHDYCSLSFGFQPEKGLKTTATEIVGIRGSVNEQKGPRSTQAKILISCDPVSLLSALNRDLVDRHRESLF